MTEKKRQATLNLSRTSEGEKGPTPPRKVKMRSLYKEICEAFSMLAHGRGTAHKERVRNNKPTCSKKEERGFVRVDFPLTGEKFDGKLFFGREVKERCSNKDGDS